MANPPPLNPADIDKYFVDFPDPPPNTFELALVLGGTVSAGAYTAGALDFLFEALDAWTTGRDAPEPDPDAPRHRVQIRVIAGTSGGGVNAAIAARALAYKIPAVSRGLTPVGNVDPKFGQLTGNPFYDVWCSMLTLDRFLDPADLQSGEPQSLLNGSPIDGAALHIATFDPPDRQVRPYLGEPLQNAPLRVILTMTNLHGIPYRTVFDSAGGPSPVGETFVDHADHIRFAVAYWNQAAFEPRPDEMVLTFDTVRMPRAASWGEFSLFARATAAFPIGFPARVLNRQMLDYQWRVTALPPDQDGVVEIRALTPDWDQLLTNGMLPGNYTFVAVDGGATNNEPIALARTALCGIKKRNPRDPLSATRAVLLIDPFSGEAGLGVPPGGLFSVATGTLGALLQQTRYDTADIVLAADPNVFSRFMISADRDGQIGEKAIASGGLGAFIGFACAAFTRHDYLLGRANCQKLLRDRLGVDPENPVVKGMWTEDQIAANSFTIGPQRYVRLIPLLANAAVEETTDPWPVGALDPAKYHDAIEARWKALLKAETSDSWWTELAGWLGGLVTEGAIADFACKKMRQSLSDWGLLPPGAS